LTQHVWSFQKILFLKLGGVSETRIRGEFPEIPGNWKLGGVSETRIRGEFPEKPGNWKLGGVSRARNQLKKPGNP
jgi:hypothetical protein